jgi:hypothetical protein
MSDIESILVKKSCLEDIHLLDNIEDEPGSSLLSRVIINGSIGHVGAKVTFVTPCRIQLPTKHNTKK